MHNYFPEYGDTARVEALKLAIHGEYANDWSTSRGASAVLFSHSIYCLCTTTFCSSLPFVTQFRSHKQAPFPPYPPRYVLLFPCIYVTCAVVFIPIYLASKRIPQPCLGTQIYWHRTSAIVLHTLPHLIFFVEDPSAVLRCCKICSSARSCVCSSRAPAAEQGFRSVWPSKADGEHETSTVFVQAGRGGGGEAPERAN